MTENKMKRIIIVYLLEHAELRSSTREQLECGGVDNSLNYLSNLLSRCWNSLRRRHQLQLLEELGEINAIN